MKKAVSIVVSVIAWLVLILAFLITIIVFSSGRNNGVANLMGFIPLTVESDSMKPTFSKDDLIICKEVDDINNLKENDVITFWTVIDGKRVKNTHRIVSVNEFESTRSFVTRGDANSLDDTLPAYASDIIGKWTNFKVGGLGKFMNFLRTKTGFFVCILLPMAIFFLFELYKFIVTLIEVKRPQPVGPELDEEEIKRRAVEEYLASQKEAEAAKEKAEEKAEEVKEKAEDKAEEVKEKAEAAAETVKEKVEEAKEKTEEAAETIKEKVEETAEAAEEKAEEAAEEIKDKAEEVIEAAEEKAEETAESAESDE